MNREMHSRLEHEQQQLVQMLPRVAPFAQLVRTVGAPPTSYRFLLLPFGFRVRTHAGGGLDEPVAYDPDRHGAIELVLSADPRCYPARPWQAQLVTGADVALFSPHVGAEARVRGVVCWLDQAPTFDPLAWPVHTVLDHVLRILSGETWHAEGYALQEEAKHWFLEHADELPFARVPFGPAAADPAPADPAAAPAVRATTESVLGIEFGGCP